MRGRKPVPTLLADLHGRPSKTKPPPNEPKPAGVLYDPPDHLSDTQKANWAYAIRNSPPGLLTLIDRGILTVWVVAEDMHRAATIQLNKIGSIIIKAPITGVPIQNPWMAVLNRQAKLMKEMANELGFSPVSRPRLGDAARSPERMNNDREAAKGKPRPSLEAFLATNPSRPTQH